MTRTARCPTPRRARACSARCSPRLCAHAATIGDALALLRAARRAAPRRAGATIAARAARRTRRRRPRRRSPTTPASTSSATPTGRRSTSASRSACARARARTSAARRRGRWTGQAEHVDYQATRLRARRAAAREPADQGAAAAGQRARASSADGYVYLRCRLDIPFPILEVAREPARRPRGQRRPAARPRARRPSCVEQLNSLFGAAPLRPRAAAARAPVRLRPDGPLPVALPGRPRPEPLPRAARRGARRCSPATATAARALLAHVDEQMRAAAAPSSATSARPGCGAAASGCEALLERLGGVLRATTRGRGSCSPPHPRGAAASTRSGSSAAASSTGARCPADVDELAAPHARGAARAADARRRRRRGCRPTRSTRCGLVARRGWRARGAPAMATPRRSTPERPQPGARGTACPAPTPATAPRRRDAPR